MSYTRQQYCELIIREIYGGQPTDDAAITVNQVNLLLNGAIATAAKLNFTENKRTDNVEYINDSFYATFKNRDITKIYSERYLYTLVLPQIPVGIGSNIGVASGEAVSPDGQVSQPFVFLSANEWSRRKTMRRIPNKILCNYEGSTLQMYSTLQLNDYKAQVRMVSGGDTALSAIVNVPDDYFKTILAYVKEELVFERSQPKDLTSDGKDLATSR